MHFTGVQRPRARSSSFGKCGSNNCQVSSQSSMQTSPKSSLWRWVIIIIWIVIGEWYPRHHRNRVLQLGMSNTNNMWDMYMALGPLGVGTNLQLSLATWKRPSQWGPSAKVGEVRNSNKPLHLSTRKDMLPWVASTTIKYFCNATKESPTSY